MPAVTGAAMLVALAWCQRGVVRALSAASIMQHLDRPAAVSARGAHSRVAGYIAQAGSAGGAL